MEAPANLSKYDKMNLPDCGNPSEIITAPQCPNTYIDLVWMFSQVAILFFIKVHVVRVRTSSKYLCPNSELAEFYIWTISAVIEGVSTDLGESVLKRFADFKNR